MVGAFGLDHRAAGIFLGGTIHDVAQVVGAGYSVSPETGDTATIVKLLRVAMLLPVCLAIGVALHVRGREAARSAPLLPWFAVAFAVLVIVNSAGCDPAAASTAGRQRGLALVPGHRDRRHRHEDLAASSLVDMGLKPVLLVVLRDPLPRRAGDGGAERLDWVDGSGRRRCASSSGAAARTGASRPSRCRAPGARPCSTS